MSSKKISRNPSFTPSPQLREHLNNSEAGVTHTLNKLYDRYTEMLEADAVRLTPDGEFALREHLQGVFVDKVAIQSIPQDIPETGNAELIEKLSGACYSQLLATLVRYKLL